MSCWYWLVSSHTRNVRSSPFNSGFGSGPGGKSASKWRICLIPVIPVIPIPGLLPRKRDLVLKRCLGFMTRLTRARLSESWSNNLQENVFSSELSVESRIEGRLSPQSFKRKTEVNSYNWTSPMSFLPSSITFPCASSMPSISAPRTKSTPNFQRKKRRVLSTDYKYHLKDGRQNGG